MICKMEILSHKLQRPYQTSDNGIWVILRIFVHIFGPIFYLRNYRCILQVIEDYLFLMYHRMSTKYLTDAHAATGTLCLICKYVPTLLTCMLRLAVWRSWLTSAVSSAGLEHRKFSTSSRSEALWSLFSCWWWHLTTWWYFPMVLARHRAVISSFMRNLAIFRAKPN